ncbi:MAG: hypothetical protein ACXVEF_12295, partial [Polyangiales bacterium]
DEARRMIAKVDTAGLSLRAVAGAWAVSLRPHVAGSLERATRVSTTVPGGVALDRGEGVTEWYAPHPRGIEQGWTFSRAPVGASRLLHVVVTVEGLRPVQRPQWVELVDGSGAPVLGYGELAARDARGTTIPSTMRVEGSSVALDIDASEATFPVVVDPLVWGILQASLTATDPPSGCFGRVSALDLDTAVVADPCKTAAGVFLQGELYVYTRTAGVWTPQAQLFDPMPRTSEQLGYAGVAISGNTIVATANAGSPLVFVRSGTSWTSQGVLAGGSSYIAIDGNTALAGTNVYVRSGSTWSVQATLPLPGGSVSAVALHGDTAVIGAPDAIIGSNVSQGAAYVFLRTGTTWAQQARLLASDGAACSGFGVAVDVNGDTAIVGSRPGAVCGGGVAAAYIFVRSGSSWSQQAELAKGTSVTSVAIDSDSAIISPGNSVFTRTGTTWTASKTLAGSDMVDLSGGTALVGTNVYVTAHANGDACASSGECLSGFCVDGVCCNSACTSACQACSAIRKGSGSDGVCGPLTDGATDARCPPIGCAALGMGLDEKLVSAWQCLAGACQPSSAVGCAPYRCESSPAAHCSSACASDGDCAATAHCAGSTCVAKAANGAACAAANECSSGFCVDAVCCDRACDAQCEACDSSGSKGTCATVVGKPHGARLPCNTDGNECGSTCVGASSTCAKAPSDTPCKGGCVGGTLSLCDGAGACVSSFCPNDFGCAGPTSCATSCTKDAECTDGYGCRAGRCIPKSAQCSADGASSTSSTGVVTDCAPYRCDSTGSCATRCTTSEVCASGFSCDPTLGQCVVAPGETSSSGGCALGGRSSLARPAIALFACALVMATRLRRRAMIGG